MYQMSFKDAQRYVGISSISQIHIYLQKQRSPGQNDAPSIWRDSTLLPAVAEAAGPDCHLYNRNKLKGLSRATCCVKLAVSVECYKPRSSV